MPRIFTPDNYSTATMRSEGFKVVLLGEGGDELFAGYSRHFDLLQTEALRDHRFGIVAGQLSALVGNRYPHKTIGQTHPAEDQAESAAPLSVYIQIQQWQTPGKIRAHGWICQSATPYAQRGLLSGDFIRGAV